MWNSRWTVNEILKSAYKSFLHNRLWYKKKYYTSSCESGLKSSIVHRIVNERDLYVREPTIVPQRISVNTAISAYKSTYHGDFYFSLLAFFLSAIVTALLANFKPNRFISHVTMSTLEKSHQTLPQIKYWQTQNTYWIDFNSMPRKSP